MAMLLQLGGLFLVNLFTVGPVLGLLLLLLLLNFRDKRQAMLLERVWQLTPKDLSDRIAIQVRSAVLTRRSVVTVEMQACSRDEIWEAIAHWAASLPPGGRLLVNGTVDRGVSARFTVETGCPPPLPCPPRPATAAG